MPDSQLRILLVDDNPDDRILVVRELRKEFGPLHVEQIIGPEGFNAALEKGGFDLVITDYRLQWTDGLAVLREVKKRWADLPVIMFTGTGSEEVAVEAMKAGLDDYVLKSPKHFSRIPAAVKLALERAAQRRRLNEVESRYRNLVQRVPIGLYSLDNEGKFTSANPTLAQMLGYPAPEALLGNSLWDLFVRREAVEKWLNALLQEGELRAFEYELRRPDGKTIWVSDHSALVRDSAGAVTQFEGSLEDVTDRKRAEQALCEERNLLRTILDNAPDHIYVKDRNGRYLLANRSHLRTLGVDSDEEVIGKTAFDFLPQRLAELYYADEQRVISSGHPVINRLEPIVDKHENELWLLTTRVPLRDSSGNIVGVVVISRDITELRKVEAERNRLAVAVERAADGIAIVDQDFKVRYANRIYAELVGKPMAQILGQHLQSFDRLQLDPDVVEEVQRSLRDKQVWSGRVKGKRADGSEMVCELKIASFKTEEAPEKVNYVVSVRDVTEMEQLRRQLEQAQRLEAIGRLAGGVAHDFNNVLTAITGYADLVLMDLAPSDPVRKDVEEIKKAASRAASLTRQLLAFGRRLVLQPRVLNLNELVEDLSKMLKRLIGEDIEFVTYLEPELGNVYADPAQIEQVIVNLAVNARDAMPGGGKLIIETRNVTLNQEYVRTHPGSKPGRYVMLAVTDTGIGMDEETKAHIFEPFFTTKGGEGTGLGLSQVYGIVKQSGGSIWVYSEPGRGTTFKIYLPRVDAPAAEPAEPKEHAGELKGSETVLLVEDDETVRDLACSVLKRFGYEVLEAKNPTEALRLSEGHEGPIHLLITDVIMPGMNGKELAERLQEGRPELRVLYASGYTDNVIVSHGLLDSGVDFLAKPFGPDNLLRKVREILDRR